MPRKRSNGDIGKTSPHFCPRCERQFSRGGGPSHFRTCVAVRAAQQYQRNLEAHYLNDESYTTPILTHTTADTSSHTVVHEELELLQNDTNADNEQNDVAQHTNTEGCCLHQCKHISCVPARIGHSSHSTMYKLAGKTDGHI